MILCCRERREQEQQMLEKQQKERKERERIEQEREREREREKQEREDKERREQENAASKLVSRHFEESLRLANQKVCSKIMFELQRQLRVSLIYCSYYTYSNCFRGESGII